MAWAMDYIEKVGGIASEADYPYTAKDGECTYDSSRAVVKTTGAPTTVTLGDEVALKEALYTFGPVAIAFQVFGTFSSYHGGIYSSVFCSNKPEDGNHAVLLVGYGSDEFSNDYWLVKNSWGADWGESGYFRIARGSNMCGIANCNVLPSDVVDVSKTFMQ